MILGAPAREVRFALDSPLERDADLTPSRLTTNFLRLIQEVRFARDSPLEQAGFELAVPP
jgi:hypothetical protein